MKNILLASFLAGGLLALPSLAYARCSSYTHISVWETGVATIANGKVEQIFLQHNTPAKVMFASGTINTVARTCFEVDVVTRAADYDFDATYAQGKLFMNNMSIAMTLNYDVEMRLGSQAGVLTLDYMSDNYAIAKP